MAPSVVASASKLPHTGVTASQCYQAGSATLVSCSSSGAQALNSQQDGNRASINAKSYSEVPKASGGTWARTECVKDNITGLMWEGKTASGTRAGSNTYTNYHSSYYGTQDQMDAGSNTYGYVAAVNASGLCGFTDWRLPTAKELQTLVNYGVAYPGPTIDTTWFPNTQGSWYCSSSPYVGDSSGAWVVYFDDGGVSATATATATTTMCVWCGRGAACPSVERLKWQAPECLCPCQCACQRAMPHGSGHAGASGPAPTSLTLSCIGLTVCKGLPGNCSKARGNRAALFPLW